MAGIVARVIILEGLPPMFALMGQGDGTPLTHSG
jgi:hypothetical protein